MIKLVIKLIDRRWQACSHTIFFHFGEKSTNNPPTSMLLIGMLVKAIRIDIGDSSGLD